MAEHREYSDSSCGSKCKSNVIETVQAAGGPIMVQKGHVLYCSLSFCITHCRSVKKKTGETKNFSHGNFSGVTSHDKETNYYVNTTQWCEGIRPCPVHSGTPSTSHNTGEAPNAFKVIMFVIYCVPSLGPRRDRT